MKKSSKNEETLLISHLMRRAGFGITPTEMDEYQNMAYADIVERLLNPTDHSKTMSEDIIYRRFPEYHAAPGVDASSSWGFRMITTENPLEEKMAFFWHGVFATGNDKLNNPISMHSQIETFRRHGTGRFDDILLQLSKDPAMLIFLDNQTNHGSSINENYGREILELFSLGVGNYTEDDVKECARAFTGWSVKNAEYMAMMGNRDSIWPYSRIGWHHEFRKDDHDNGRKTFLGETGNFNGEDIIKIICRQDAAAQFVSRHLYNFFVADEVPVPSWHDTPPRDPEAIAILARTYMESDHDIKTMLTVLFNSDFFKEARYTKVKGPVELIVNTLRLTGEVEMPSLVMSGAVEEAGYMGQQLFYPPSVEGWHGGEEWINSGSLVDRVNFATSHIGNLEHPGIRSLVDRIVSLCKPCPSPTELVDTILELLGCTNISENTRGLLIDMGSKNGEIDISTYPDSLGFDEMISHMLRMIVSTREYQMA